MDAWRSERMRKSTRARESIGIDKDAKSTTSRLGDRCLRRFHTIS
jgi:hypothetical protein